MIWILVIKITILFLWELFILFQKYNSLFLKYKKKRNTFFNTRVYTFVLEGNKLTNKRLLTMISESLISRMWG